MLDTPSWRMRSRMPAMSALPPWGHPPPLPSRHAAPPRRLLGPLECT